MDTQHVLRCAVENKKGYIELIISGDLTSDTLIQFKKDLQEALEVIQKEYTENGTRVHILLDVTHFSGKYDLESLNTLVQFAKHNKDFVEKTASFGGSDKVKMSGEIAIVLSGRNNIKVFDERADAVAWLLE